MAICFYLVNPLNRAQSGRTRAIVTFKQQFACKAAEFGELAAAFAQHCKQYDARFRAATAIAPIPRNISRRLEPARRGYRKPQRDPNPCSTVGNGDRLADRRPPRSNGGGSPSPLSPRR